MESIKVVIISEDTSIRVNLKKKLADRDIQIVGYADFKDESRLKVDGLLLVLKYQLTRKYFHSLRV